MSKPRRVSHLLKDAGSAIAFIGCHTLVVIVFIAGIKAVTYVLNIGGDDKLFDLLPLKYVIDFMDCAILSAYAVYGCFGAIRWFREDTDE